MKTGLRNWTKKILSGMLVLTLVLQMFQGMNFVVAKQNTSAPDTYTVTLENAGRIYISNEIAPTEYPVTLTYTVQAGANQQSTSGMPSGVLATAAPEDTRSPYYGGEGSLIYWTWNRPVTAERTYTFEMSLDAQGAFTYEGQTVKPDGTTTAISHGNDNSWVTGNVNATHFGIWIGDGPENQNAVLTNVTCVDAAGNDLGVKAKAATGTCTVVKNEVEEPIGPDTYTVTLENAARIYISNEIAPTEYPVTLTYTVQAGANQQSTSGMPSGVLATAEPEDTRSPYYGGEGSLIYWTWNRPVTAERTYTFEMSLDAQGAFTYEGQTVKPDGTTTAIGHGNDNTWITGNVTATHFGVWIGDGPENQNAVLTNVTCVDAAGNDLGVKAKAATGTCTVVKDEIEEPTGPDTYTVTLENAARIYISNEIAPTEYPVTLTYTVQAGANQQSTSGMPSGVLATATPEDTRSPYYGGEGSLIYWTWNRPVTAERTYTFEMSLDAQGTFTYEGQTIKTDGTTTAIGHGNDNSWVTGNINATHFGIWIGDGSQNAVLTNVTCVDATGTDLGVKAKAATGTCTVVKDESGTPEDPETPETPEIPEEPKELDVYRVTLENASRVYVSNDKAPTKYPITLTYTVWPGANQQSAPGLPSGVLATATPEDTRSPYYGGEGSLIYWTWNRPVTVDRTYVFEMSLNAQGTFSYEGQTIKSDGTTTAISHGNDNTWVTGNVNATHFGIWIGDGSQNAVLTNVTCVDAAGNDLGIKAKAATGSCTIEVNPTDEPDMPVVPDGPIVKPELRQLTLKKFGITDGVYRYTGNDLVATGTSGSTLMNTSLTTKIVFSEHANSRLIYGGKPSAWHGISFTTQSGGKIQIYAAGGEFSESYLLDPAISGCNLVGEEIELTIELFEHYGNAKLGVYINGKLYDNQYFHLTLSRAAEEVIGKHLSFYIGNKEGTIRLGEEVPAPTIDESFTKLTFNHYGITSGKYSYNNNDLATAGVCELKNLDRVVFSDTIHFSKALGARLHIGGKQSGWHGLSLTTTSDGKLIMNEAEGKMPQITFDPEVAGVSFTETDIQLTMSFEYVDSDEDGQKDDVKLGVWFNGKPYADRWIYLRNVAELLGNKMGIYSASKKAYLKIETKLIPINFTEFGFTERWEYELKLKK